MLEIRGLSKTYAKGAVKAVDDLTLTINKGEIFGFIGPNGAGKTTTIKSIIGILPIETGSVTVNGFDVKRESIRAKQSIGYVPDDHAVYNNLKGIEYLNFMADMYGVSANERKERMDRHLEIFDLKNDITQPIQSYSHGMKQKLVVIGALLHNPELWILDEPMTGLDPRASHILKTEMRNHCDKGNTVFFSTHVLEVAEKLCDRIGIIFKGKLVAVGTLEELRSGEKGASLEHIFLELTDSSEGGEY